MSKRKDISWQEAEKLAKSMLEDKFGRKREFEKGKIKIGKEREFDWISSDKKVVAQVKLCTKLSKAGQNTRFKRDFLYDCVVLGKTKAKKKIFFLAADEKIFKDFKEWSKGLISDGVEMRRINPRR